VNASLVSDVDAAKVALAVLDDLPGFVRRCIKARGVTRKQAAREMDISEQSLCHLLAGRTCSGTTHYPPNGPTQRVISQMLAWCAEAEQ
jgi:hypothetical protein